MITRFAPNRSRTVDDVIFESMRSALALGAERDGEAQFKVWQSLNGGDIIFPVDPARLAADIGIDVHVVDLPRNVSGALVSEEGMDPVILLSSIDSNNRRRFTCAHELGHHLRGDANDVERRDEKASWGSDPKEIYANSFAAAVLMPAAYFRRLAADRSVGELASIFGVSAAAVRLRCKNLDIVTND